MSGEWDGVSNGVERAGVLEWHAFQPGSVLTVMALAASHVRSCNVPVSGSAGSLGSSMVSPGDDGKS
jgi:hypothetical protein